MVARRVDHLVKMAEEITLNLGAGHDDAVAGEHVAEHIHRFWTPAMRLQLLDFWHHGGQVTAVLAAALQKLEEEDKAWNSAT